MGRRRSLAGDGREGLEEEEGALGAEGGCNGTRLFELLDVGLACARDVDSVLDEDGWGAPEALFTCI